MIKMIKYDSIYDIHDYILYYIIYFINVYNQKYFLIVKITYNNFFLPQC